ncbi:MAG: thioredoxin family protein [Gemmatales bacterium]
MKSLLTLAIALGLTLSLTADDPKPEQKTKADKPEAKIYDEKADAKALINTALESAKRENRRVLIQWGGNWCSWCVLLHNKFKSDPTLAKTLRYEYDVVYIDSKNADLMKQYNVDQKAGVPYLTILDADGKVLTNQETEFFETKADGKNGHDAKKLQEFLVKNQTKPKDANELLSAALAEAAKTDRMVFLHFGAPWCGWCHKLDAWLLKKEVAPIFSKDYVDLKIDQDRMTNAKEVFVKYNKAGEGGIPWFVILDSNGKALINSDANKNNIGFPYEPNEIDHFVKMLNATRKKLTDDDVKALKVSLTPPAKVNAK